MSVWVFAFLAAAGAGVIFWAWSAPSPLKPVDPETDYGPPPEATTPTKRMRFSPAELGLMVLLGPLSAIVSPFVSKDKGAALQNDLNRAGLSLKSTEFSGLQALSGLVVGILLFLRFGNFIMLAVGLLVGFFLPLIYLGRRISKRRRAFENQLADTITLISNGIKAGYSLQQALVSVVEGGRQPLAEEFARVVRETSLGLNLDDALDHANERIKSKDFDLMVTAIMIHRTVGGNLAEVLDKIIETIRERVKVAGEVRVLTAQARASGYIITGLPFAVGAILSLISPSFERPLFTQPLGWGLCVVGLISISIGYAMIRKITDIHL
jgi:tight adherence protein B